MTIIFQNQTFVKNNKSQQGFFIDPTLKHNIDTYLIQGVKKKFDGIVLVTGLEGTGKSTFAKQLAAYCGSAFGKKLLLDNIVFDGKQLMDRIDKSEPGTPIIFDEAIMDMASQDASNDMQKILIKKFTLIRKKRLFIFLVIPSMFMLRKYFAIYRTRVMINCYCPDGMTRGYFRAYSFVNKKNLYLRGWKEMNMTCCSPSFKGCFADSTGFFINEDKYEYKKDRAIERLTRDNKKDELEKVKNDFDIKFLKLKETVKEFKLNANQKIAIAKSKVSEQVRLKSVQYKEKFKSEIWQNKQSFNRALAFAFKTTGEHYKLLNQKDLTVDVFIKILKNSNIFEESPSELKASLKDGQSQMKELSIL